jgi:cell division control protein 24
MATMTSPYQHQASQSTSNLATVSSTRTGPPPVVHRPSFPRINSTSATSNVIGKAASAGNLQQLAAATAAAAAANSASSGAPQAANFVSNRPANAESSLYQISLTLISRLERVPGMQVYLDACENDHLLQPSRDSGSTTDLTQEIRSPTASTTSLLIGNISAGNRVDPVTKLWRFLRMGSSLCALFNGLNPKNPLKAGPPSNDVKASKRAVYDFVQGCKAELDYSDDELFTISNVFSDSTADLIKVRSNGIPAVRFGCAELTRS